MKKRLSVLASLLILSGCSLTKKIDLEQKRISTQVEGRVYNDIANKYMKSMTTATVNEEKPVDPKYNYLRGITLIYTVKGNEVYWDELLKEYKTENPEFWVHKSDVPKVKAAIRKFKKWDKQTKLNKELLSKEIVRWESPWRNWTLNKSTFVLSFWSANSNNNFMKVCHIKSLDDQCLGGGFVLDAEGINNLERDLNALENDTFSTKDTSANYL